MIVKRNPLFTPNRTPGGGQQQAPGPQTKKKNHKNIKKQLDNYLSKKDKIYTRYKIDEANKRVSQLDKEYSRVFQNPLVENYFKSTQNFNLLMQSVYKSIEGELLR